MTGTGEHIEIGDQENTEWLNGARVGLGALGIITEIKMQLVERLNSIDRYGLLQTNTPWKTQSAIGMRTATSSSFISRFPTPAYC